MTPVVIAPNQEAAGRTRQGTFAPAQPCATRDSAQIKFTEHVGQGVFALSAICAGDGACVRAAGILGSLKTETVAPQIQWPAPNFQSAHASRAVTAGVLSVISAPTSAFFAIFNAYRAACDLADRAYENERAKHAPDTALVRFADAVAGKTTEKEEAK